MASKSKVQTGNPSSPLHYLKFMPCGMISAPIAGKATRARRGKTPLAGFRAFLAE